MLNIKSEVCYQYLPFGKHIQYGTHEVSFFQSLRTKMCQVFKTFVCQIT